MMKSIRRCVTVTLVVSVLAGFGCARSETGKGGQSEPSSGAKALGTSVEGPAEGAQSDAEAQEAMPLGEDELRASGNEPFWNVRVSVDGIIFAELGREPDLVFPYSPARESDGAFAYASLIHTPERHEIEIAVRRRECMDTMSGARFDYEAVVTLDGREYRGCAKRREE